MKNIIHSALFMTACAFVLAPLPARADAFVIPWVGSAFGSTISNGQTTFGVSAGAMGAGIVGGEADFGWSPSYFGTKSDFGSNTVLDLMANVILGVPVGGQHGAGIRPYVVGGLGLIRTQIDGGSIARVSSSTNMLGWDAGGGVMGYFSDHVGLRGDLRYLRATSDLSTGVTSFDLGGNRLHFWRASIGVVIR
jgi:opacity protein-like surface antigen